MSPIIHLVREIYMYVYLLFRTWRVIIAPHVISDTCNLRAIFTLTRETRGKSTVPFSRRVKSSDHLVVWGEALAWHSCRRNRTRKHIRRGASVDSLYSRTVRSHVRQHIGHITSTSANGRLWKCAWNKDGAHIFGGCASTNQSSATRSHRERVTERSRETVPPCIHVISLVCRTCNMHVILIATAKGP